MKMRGKICRIFVRWCCTHYLKLVARMSVINDIQSWVSEKMTQGDPRVANW
jgi:hypothetical protein